MAGERHGGRERLKTARESSRRESFSRTTTHHIHIHAPAKVCRSRCKISEKHLARTLAVLRFHTTSEKGYSFWHGLAYNTSILFPFLHHQRNRHGRPPLDSMYSLSLSLSLSLRNRRALAPRSFNTNASSVFSRGALLLSLFSSSSSLFFFSLSFFLVSCRFRVDLEERKKRTRTFVPPNPNNTCFVHCRKVGEYVPRMNRHLDCR